MFYLRGGEGVGGKWRGIKDISIKRGVIRIFSLYKGGTAKIKIAQNTIKNKFHKFLKAI